jgi:chromosome segregation ATPase
MSGTGSDHELGLARAQHLLDKQEIDRLKQQLLNSQRETEWLRNENLKCSSELVQADTRISYLQQKQATFDEMKSVFERSVVETENAMQMVKAHQIRIDQYSSFLRELEDENKRLQALLREERSVGALAKCRAELERVRQLLENEQAYGYLRHMM